MVHQSDRSLLLVAPIVVPFHPSPPILPRLAAMTTRRCGGRRPRSYSYSYSYSCGFDFDFDFEYEYEYDFEYEYERNCMDHGEGFARSEEEQRH